MWIASAGLHPGANAAVASIIGGAFGHTGNFKVWKFVLFYTARPRLSWIIQGFLGTVKTRSNRSRRREDNDSEPQGQNHGQGENNPYWCAAKPQLIAELVLQAMACYVMRAIVQQGSQTFVYDIAAQDAPNIVRLMYAGALYYLVLGGISLIALTFVLLTMATHRDSSKYQHYTRIVLFMFLLSTWLGSWLFWAGFVNFMAGQGLYCPQKLPDQATVWISISLLGISAGAGAY
jgi:hypothetical protein